ncbi:peptidase C39 [Acinetobacter qingfengensis]|uniref:Peptidase C39 n=1 Tax=Acinetobacter qingfengensis TaxID=1262585 RepID=A0A1E7RC15_9GAMM|nr:cysteine peptidase family C39 domain-containing protein [Acinetobacter qingfengensis]KAA8734845.1 peptidase C39 [Acinetobacter qingfengensis]OEY96888.1 peptidase C39 [Acinetobacter qingfengensis]
MALDIPEALVNLPANCGVFAVWMVLHHHGMNMAITEIAKQCQHDSQDGTFTIALAVALKNLGFGVSFYTDDDPDIGVMERKIYHQAKQLNIPVAAALSYQQIQNEIAQGKLVIAYYDTLDGEGNQSLIYAIDDQQVYFFDSFEPMSVELFVQQRKADGICQQVIVIDDVNVQIHATQIN